VTAGLVVLVYAIVKAEQWGWGSTDTLGLGAVAIALLVAFVFIERRSAAPLVRLGIFSIRSLAASNGVMLVVGGALFSMFFFCSLYIQRILGYTALEAGFAFLPVTAGIIIGAGLAQQLIGKVGVKPVTVTGMTVAALGLVVLAATVAVDGTYVDVLFGLVPMSIGMGLTFVPLTLIATTNVSDDDAGLASGLFNTSQQVGGALGLAILSTLATDRTTGKLADLGHAATSPEQAAAVVEGWQLAFSVSAGLMVVGVILISVVLKRRDVEHVHVGEAVPAAV
jgi:predicted MFS family arabinose efflux permease